MAVAQPEASTLPAFESLVLSPSEIRFDSPDQLQMTSAADSTVPQEANALPDLTKQAKITRHGLFLEFLVKNPDPDAPYSPASSMVWVTNSWNYTGNWTSHETSLQAQSPGGSETSATKDEGPTWDFW